MARKNALFSLLQRPVNMSGALPVARHQNCRDVTGDVTHDVMCDRRCGLQSTVLGRLP